MMGICFKTLRKMNSFNSCVNFAAILMFYTAFTHLFVSQSKEKLAQMETGEHRWEAEFSRRGRHKENKNSRYGTTCSEEAFLAGNHQKVISYSFVNTDKAYYSGVDEIVSTIGTIYPGWKVRIYANKTDINFLKSILSSNYSYLFFCDINHLPPPLGGTLGSVQLTTWRFAPLGDPQVEVFVSRDIDSQILQREKDAVDQWLNRSNKTLHIMRDYINQVAQIMAGLWGLRINDSSRNHIRTLRDQMLRLPVEGEEQLNDQELLHKVIWTAFQNDALSHDSYTCLGFDGTSPFPSQRARDLSYVGSRFFRGTPDVTVMIECPVQCRPRNYLYWNFC